MPGILLVIPKTLSGKLYNQLCSHFSVANKMNSLEEVEIYCPYCGEIIEILIDCSVAKQSYIEDCQVCCRPIDIDVIVDAEGIPCVDVSQEDDV